MDNTALDDKAKVSIGVLEMTKHYSLLTVLALFIAAGVAAAGSQKAEAPKEFGGDYDRLSSAQRRLVDDVYLRAGEVVGEELDPETSYNQVRLSVRTTFEAVTHALERSTLTDSTNAKLGTALDLIEHIETVRGRVNEAGGDLQFRIYVRLKSDALGRLDQSQEFSRKRDNSRYHKGYPLNYRQEGGYPSVQISMTEDGLRADIDVDYRSAKMPQALFNGHLSSANSDVRAGDNHQRHVGRWTGLANWWRGLFGLRVSDEPTQSPEELKREVPPFPRAGSDTVEDAAHDFLTAWLVEKNSVEAMAYFSRRAYNCMALKYGTEGEPFDYGMAPLRMLQGLKRATEQLGPVSDLNELLTGIRIAKPDFEVIQQPHHSEFVLYGVPDHLAAKFECANRLRLGASPPRPSEKQSRFKSFATVFFLDEVEGHGATLALLWEKEKDYWRIVSYETEPAGAEQTPAVPDIRPAGTTAELEKHPGDPSLVTATEQFYEKWLIKKDYEAASSNFLPQSYPCVNSNLEGDERPQDLDGLARRLRESLARFGDHIGSITSLEQVITGADFWNPAVKELTHGREAAYTLLSIPDWMARDVDCQSQLEGAEPTASAAREPIYGDFAASAVSTLTIAGEPATLTLFWTKETGQWKIFAFEIVDP